MSCRSTLPLFWMPAWVLVLLFAGTTATGAEPPDAEKAAGVDEGRPIDRGFVILEGQYLPLPYVVQRRGAELLINGHRIGEQWTGQRRWGPGMGRGFHSWRGPGPGTFPQRDRQLNRMAWIERRLEDDAVLIGFGPHATKVFEDTAAFDVLEILVSDTPAAAKVESLADIGAGRVSTAQWTELVETFQPPAEFEQRVRALARQRERDRQALRATVGSAQEPALLGSGAVKYVVTVAALVLAVFALGNLLNHRPEARARWRDLDTSGDGVPMVVRNVVLLVLLGTFDFGCTMIASQAGGFLEMNPLANELLRSPLALAAFKASAFLLACAMLLMLRRYRGAQIASWWLCLVCTVVVFRWATYNSLFFT